MALLRFLMRSWFALLYSINTKLISNCKQHCGPDLQLAEGEGHTAIANFPKGYPDFIKYYRISIEHIFTVYFTMLSGLISRFIEFHIFLFPAMDSENVLYF